MTSKEEPLSELIKRLPSGDSMAQRKIWNEFADKVARQARRYLSGVGRRESDEEDVAVRVLNSLFRRLSDGRQDPPNSRGELWNLLLGMTRNKSAEQARRKLAQKRGGGRVRGESALEGTGDTHRSWGIDAIADSAPDARAAFEEAQHLSDRLDALGDDELRQIALLRMAEYSDAQIATMLGCSTRTVQRRLEEIRSRITGDDRRLRQ